MPDISCTFLKCEYNHYGRLGKCQKASIQIGGYAEKGSYDYTQGVCSDYKPVKPSVDIFSQKLGGINAR